MLFRLVVVTIMFKDVFLIGNVYLSESMFGHIYKYILSGRFSPATLFYQ